jgi:trehalose 6-phosphate synthase/phosphatase
MRLIIISNRLPVKANQKENGEISFQRSEGGLATGLGSLETNIEKHWIGWPGIYTQTEKMKI